MEHQPQPTNLRNTMPTSTDQRDARMTGMLKDAILARVAASNSPKVVTQELRSYVERKLHDFFPNFDSPSHPPYASMILRAIVKLDEEGGSSEGSISGFIRKEYEELPWQHEAFLSHHLRKLCRTGEIVLTDNGRYVIVVKHGDFGNRKEMGCRMNIRRGRKPRRRQFRNELQRQLKEKVGQKIHLIKQDNEEECRAEGQGMEVIDEWNQVRERQIEVLENQNEVREQTVEGRNKASRQDAEATDQQIERQSVKLNVEEQNNPQYQQIEVLEEPSNLQELEFEASEEHTLAHEQQNVVTLKQNKPQKPQIAVVYEKQKDDQVIVTIPNASEITSQCLDCNGLSLPLVEPCMELEKKETEFLKELMENSNSLGRMGLPKYGIARSVIEEEKDDCLEVEQQQLTKSSLTDKESSIEVIEAHSKLQHQEDVLLLREEIQPLGNHTEGTTRVLGLCCFKGDGISESFWVPFDESTFIVEKDERTISLEQKQHKQQRKIVCGERKFTIICGLRAQKLTEPNIYDRRIVCKSGPNFTNKHQSPGQSGSLPLPNPDTITTMGALLSLEHHHDDEQYQPEGRGKGQAQLLSKAKFYGQWRTYKSNPENDQRYQSRQAKNFSRPMPDTFINMSDLLPSDHHHEDEQHLPEDLGQGQAQDLSKSKIYGQQNACKSDVENNLQHQSPGQTKNLSSPEPDTDIIMSNLLLSDQQHNDEQHLPEDQRQCHGMLQKAGGGRDCHDHDGLRVYFRRKRKSLRTYVRRKHKA